MKSLTPFYAAAGMAGLFAMTLTAESALPSAMSPIQSAATLAFASAALGGSLAWLGQVRRRYAGSRRLLRIFAALGLVMLSLGTLAGAELIRGVLLQAASSLLGLALLGAFCLVALHTRPASEHGEGAL